RQERPYRLSEMLALENCLVIVGCGSAEYFSVLSGKRHQGRTARRAGEPLYRTALGGDADISIARFGPTAPIYLHKDDVWDDHHRGGGMPRSQSAHDVG